MNQVGSELDRLIKSACESVGAVEKEPEVPKSAFHVALDEAIWLALDGGMSMAQLLGETRRRTVVVASVAFGDDSKAKTKLGIGKTTLYRIKRKGNKF